MMRRGQGDGPTAHADPPSKNTNRRATAWGFASYGIQFGAALVVIPFAYRSLNEAEIGVWFVFLTCATAVSMLDFGFTPTISRSLAYALGGATTIERVGFPFRVNDTGASHTLVASLVTATRRIFLGLAMTAMFLLGGLGTWYVWSIAKGSVESGELAFAWALFSLGLAGSVFLRSYIALLQGYSAFDVTNRSNAIAGLVNIVLAIALLTLGAGLVGIAIAYAVQFLSQGTLNRLIYLRGGYNRGNNLFARDGASHGMAFGTLWHNTWRQGATSVGAFLTIRASVLIVTGYLGLVIGARYALSLQVFSALMSVASVPLTIRLPQLAQYRLQRRTDLAIREVRFGILVGLAVYSLGAACVLALQPWIETSILDGGEFLARPQMGAMALMFLLELNMVLSAFVITTGNQVPYVWASLIAGGSIVLVSWVGLSQSLFGVAGVILAQLIIQGVYNNWRWPTMMIRQLRAERA